MYTNFDRLTDLLVVAAMFAFEWWFMKYKLASDIEHACVHPTFKERRARRASERRYRRYMRNRAAYLREHRYAD